MSSRLVVNSVRHTGASADGITLDSSGNVTFPANATCSGTATGFGKFTKYAVICDQKAQGTGGGTFTLGAWRTRDLNTEITDADGIVSISSNQFTLQAGTYFLKASAPCVKATNNQAALYNVTDSSFVQYGTNALAHISYIGFSNSLISARFTISSAKVFEIRHFSSHTNATNGFGPSFSSGDASNAGGVAIFTVVEIFKE